MIEHYLQQIQQLCPSLSRQELDFIGNGFRLRELPPKAFFLKAGEVLRANGGDVRVLNLENGCSTTNVIEKIKALKD